MEQSFITLAANGMQPESSGSSSDSVNGKQLANHTIGVNPRHKSLSEFSEFAANLEEAANAVLPQSGRSESRYTDVEVVLMRWDDDNRLGVWWELADLCKIFSYGYGFKTRIWLIPTEDPLMSIMSQSFDMVKEAGQEGKLLIVYYAGHAAMNDSQEQVWFRCVFLVPQRFKADERAEYFLDSLVEIGSDIHGTFPIVEKGFMAVEVPPRVRDGVEPII